MDNGLLKVKFSGFIGGCVLAAGLLASANGAYAQGGGFQNPRPTGAEFSDRQLTPKTDPAAAVGNDLLLAQGALGGAYPETWSTNLYYSDTDPGTGNVNQLTHTDDVFDGQGPTGSYAAGTAGVGKHTENTLADICKTAYRQGSNDLVYYQYVVTDTVCDPDGFANTATIYLAVHTYTL